MSKKQKVIDDLAQHAVERVTDMIMDTGNLLDDEEDKVIYCTKVFGHLAHANGAVTMFWLGEDMEKVTEQNMLDLKALGLLMHVAYLYANEHKLEVNPQGAATGAIKLFERIFNRKFSIRKKRKAAS